MNTPYAWQTGAVQGSAAFDEGLRQHMLRVYNYIGLGLVLTGLVAGVVGYDRWLVVVGCVMGGSALLADGVLAGSRPVPSAVLVAVVDEESRATSDAIAGALRARDVPCEVAASAQKFGKQIRYAERRGIPFVWFTGAEGAHEVKDIRSGEQVAADPATWSPPAADLRPQVVSTSSTNVTETEQ